MKTVHTLWALAATSLVNLQLLAPVALAQDAGTSGGPVLTPGTPAGATSGQPPGWINFVLIGGMVLFMYLFIIRPNAKRQKEHKTFLDSLVPGKEVITSSGLIGKVTSVSDTIVTVDLGNTSVRVLKSAISGELGRQSSAATSPT
jgi:preprotein translocase subunit YajC